jgi:TonB family protein
MMPDVHEAMLAVSNSLAASIVAKVTATTALSLAVTTLAPRSRAAVRHTLLAAAFGVLLILPIASIVAPPVRIAIPAAQDRNVPIHATALAIPRDQPAHSGFTSVVSRSGPSLSSLLFAVWIAGTVLFLVPVVMGLWQVRRLRRSGQPWPHGQAVAQSLALEAGIRRRVNVLLHPELPGPMTCGIFRPAIVLPQDAETWHAEDLTRAMLHELEHVRRGDWVSHCLARALCAAYWFHPLVWMAWHRFALEAERSCDDAVLERSEATAYADQLVGLARRLSLAAKTPFLAMANRADLAARVGAVLDARQNRGRAGKLPVALACAAAAVLVLTMSPLILVAAPQSAGTPRFSAYGAMVNVAVRVSDKDGNNVAGLQASDFAVTEDGVPQTISVFEFRRVAAAQEPISSYYIVGYYPTNPNVDGKFRAIAIHGNADTMAKLDYRAGYYARPSNRGGVGNAGVGQGLDRDTTPPVLLSKKAPEYSEEARKAKWQGTVVLSLEVDTTGRATNVKVIHSLAMGLDQKAIEALMQWRFKPAMKDGKPVTVQTEAEVNFRIF